MSSRKYIIIIGCGRLGSLLASKLSAKGHEVVVIDKHSAAFDKLGIEFSGFQVVGDASEQSILMQAEVAKADFFFAVTAEDNINLMVAQIANRIFGVQHVFARIDDPSREAVYREFGIQTISPTQLAATEFMSRVSAS